MNKNKVLINSDITNFFKPDQLWLNILRGVALIISVVWFLPIIFYVLISFIIFGGLFSLGMLLFSIGFIIYHHIKAIRTLAKSNRERRNMRIEIKRRWKETHGDR